MKLLLSLFTAIICVAGVLCGLDLLYQFWVWWVIPQFLADPASVCFISAGVVLLITFTAHQAVHCGK